MDIFLALNAAFLSLLGLLLVVAKPKNRSGRCVTLTLIACCTALVFFSVYYI